MEWQWNCKIKWWKSRYGKLEKRSACWMCKNSIWNQGYLYRRSLKL